MAECSILDIPIAAACFAKNPSGSDYVFTLCNSAFAALVGENITGKTFSSAPEKFRPLFKNIAERAENGVKHFKYSKNGIPKYDVQLKYRNDDIVVCITNLNFYSNLISYQLRKALVSVPIGVVSVNDIGKINYMNPAAYSLLGCSRDKIGKPFKSVIKLFDEDTLSAVEIEPSDKPVSYKKGLLLQNYNGNYINISLDLTPFENNNGFIAFINDLSEQHRREEEIAYLRYHDKLTGLYNRTCFEQKLVEYNKEQYLPVSILMGDANGLKMTNDIFGHRQGDEILVSIANILSIACRDEDIVARYGGDEFVILMPNTTSDEAARVCKNILHLCGNRHDSKNMVSISLGYATKTSRSENLNDTLKIAENYMYRHKLLESRSYRSSVISSLKKMLFEKSFETEEHAMRLSVLSVQIGKMMGLSQNELNDLELFSMLHDIGKIGIRDQVLLKPGNLTDEEWVEMRRHCEIGYRIARSAPELAHIADYILTHHERWDGKGYPQGLSGEQIPLLSRILAVADSYDAMVNDRYYRKALSRETAINEIKKGSGTQFDPDIVNVFLKVLEEKKETA